MILEIQDSALSDNNKMQNLGYLKFVFSDEFENLCGKELANLIREYIKEELKKPSQNTNITTQNINWLLAYDRHFKNKKQIEKSNQIKV